LTLTFNNQLGLDSLPATICTSVYMGVFALTPILNKTEKSISIFE